MRKGFVNKTERSGLTDHERKRKKRKENDEMLEKKFHKNIKIETEKREKIGSFS